MPPEISWKTKGDLNGVLEKRALMTSIMVGGFYQRQTQMSFCRIHLLWLYATGERCLKLNRPFLQYLICLLVLILHLNMKMEKNTLSIQRLEKESQSRRFV